MKAIERIAEIKIRLERGLGLFGSIKNAIYIGAGLKIIFNTNIGITLLLCFISLISFYIVGLIDLNKIKLMQKEQELMTSKYNPHLNKINILKEKDIKS